MFLFKSNRLQSSVARPPKRYLHGPESRCWHEIKARRCSEKIAWSSAFCQAWRLLKRTVKASGDSSNDKSHVQYPAITHFLSSVNCTCVMRTKFSHFHNEDSQVTIQAVTTRARKDPSTVMGNASRQNTITCTVCKPVLFARPCESKEVDELLRRMWKWWMSRVIPSK